jgi:hypothetical protein
MVDTLRRLMQCQMHRNHIIILSTLIHAVLLDCPHALVWNYLRADEEHPLLYLTRSPMDVLLCRVSELPVPPGPLVNKVTAYV